LRSQNHSAQIARQVRPGIELASLSDVGCQRQNNEDYYSYWEPISDEEFQRKGRLAIIADGMGGYEGGQEASRIAVETIEETYANRYDSDPQSSLLAGFLAAHERIRREALERPELSGMGTTCTAIALLDKQLHFAHVGDSRLYLFRKGNITRLSHDHSYVGRLVENGVISSHEAEHHPQRHILTAALGAGQDIIPDHSEEPVLLSKGDVLMLCTDGLWGLVADEQLEEAVRAKSAAEACRDLVALAKQRGGPDNITLQILRVGAIP
jgi:PPM family protein phosphatase